MYESIENFVLNILRRGSIPKHVAIIMDGNRRYGKRKYNNAKKGHEKGFKTLQNVFRWCQKLHIPVLTIYVFSIDNFRRPQDEIEYLMDLVRDSMDIVLSDANEFGVKVQVLGDVSLFPKDVQDAYYKVANETKNNRSGTLNVCAGYTSRHEMYQAFEHIHVDVKYGIVSIDDVNEDLIEDYLYSKGCPPVDLLIRTSGETRLSDFMLWQSCDHAYVEFLNILWPEFNLWQLAKVFLRYQFHIRRYPISFSCSSPPRVDTLVFTSMPLATSLK